MITGEHAVVYGERAVVAAVARRITVSLTPRSDRQVHVRSSIADPLVTHLDTLSPVDPFRPVIAVLDAYRDTVPAGFELDIRSDIDPTLGLGSSAAVIVASLATCQRFAGFDPCADPLAVHREALGIVQGLQGRGSGADVAASVFGGLLAYRAPPDTEVRPLPAPPSLALRYSGYKTPTAEVLARVAQHTRGREAEYAKRYRIMGASADAAVDAAIAEDWRAFAAALNRYQPLLVELGVSDTLLDELVAGALATPGTLAAKISGSGLGDCVLALGATPPGFSPITVAPEGMVLHG